jgi:uncharacterized protein
MKKICLILSIFALSLCISNTAYAATDRVVDEANILTDSEEDALRNEIKEIEEIYSFDVVIVTVEDSSEYDVVAAADDYFDYHGYGYGTDGDGILFYVNMRTRNWAISTKGYGLVAFTDYGTDKIGEVCSSYLSDASYYSAFEKYVDLSSAFLKEAENGKVYDVNHTYKSMSDYIKRILIVCLISLVISAIVIGIMKSKMKTAVSQPYAKAYVKEGSFKMTRDRDSFLYFHVTKTPIPKSTSSGGGTSSHSSSSGSSHGGSHGSF